MFGATRHVFRKQAPQEVIGWRIARLRDAGFEPALAIELVSDRRYDLHMLLDLVDRGCPPALAARILAPLDGPSSVDAEPVSTRVHDDLAAR